MLLFYCYFWKSFCGSYFSFRTEKEMIFCAVNSLIQCLIYCALQYCVWGLLLLMLLQQHGSLFAINDAPSFANVQILNSHRKWSSNLIFFLLLFFFKLFMLTDWSNFKKFKKCSGAQKTGNDRRHTCWVKKCMSKHHTTFCLLKNRRSNK